ncbi:hypothetical protein VOLCADRAFT_98013 [Volvox carteri f. nagariensis]|uniref:DUF7963 domain-containing protein n=1 Tax=Volvox carteri f. nagariensis TaxID=3068 RepID=D8UE79_VOLCA|nr:uncharacterized protein VOLCADRAFT_98013 [Volvox carteri f. nagariensis]EFJ41959.1 hypothetical protein VOLCADRAFT_98013 [Volvox carteri f. nagariensis]|eukprot:XP_002956996.1 hypothetical protein VOLCADRAFT_98013 [Volvox carteri f. nagariensis]
MADADAGPSKPPVSKTPKATYTYGNKELDAPAYAEALKSAKARGSASWWSFFTVILTEGVVKLKCTICGEVLGAKNPSATAPNHLMKHSKAAEVLGRQVWHVRTVCWVLLCRQLGLDSWTLGSGTKDVGKAYAETV